MFKVKEAMPKDVGRCIARMAPADMNELGISEGQIIEVEGKSITAARLLSCDSSLAEGGGRGFLQIDGIIRDNAQVGIDDRVAVRKADHHFAGSITLRPLTSTALLEKSATQSIYGHYSKGCLSEKMTGCGQTCSEPGYVISG